MNTFKNMQTNTLKKLQAITFQVIAKEYVQKMQAITKY